MMWYLCNKQTTGIRREAELCSSGSDGVGVEEVVHASPFSFFLYFILFVYKFGLSTSIKMHLG